METHDVVKEHKCDDCGKLSYLKWRLKKHIEVHSEKEKPCYFRREGKLVRLIGLGANIKILKLERFQNVWKH